MVSVNFDEAVFFFSLSSGSADNSNNTVLYSILIWDEGSPKRMISCRLFLGKFTSPGNDLAISVSSCDMPSDNEMGISRSER
jgi:hypothetical protein